MNPDYKICKFKGSRFYLNSMEVGIREFPLFKFDFITKKKEKLNMFDKSKSVFKSWKDDTPEFLNAMFKHDYNYSKLNRILKNNEEDVKSSSFFLIGF